jgi:MoaA/NifB/PqqE/SkfB family radical SAM enzyme
MKIYSLLKLNRYIQNPFIKDLGIWALHVLNKRYLVVFFDPVLACNLRCRMCYFSNEEKRKTMKGHFEQSDLVRIAEVIFPSALKLQIGCGAEPSLFKYSTEVVQLGKQYGVPYISYTTNSNLLTPDGIENLLQAGLNEFTISLHGVEKETYEYLMQGASFEKFIVALQCMSDAKKKYPDFKLRINYTVNDRNIEELSRFFDVFGNIQTDILQVRPMTDNEGEIRGIENQQRFNQLFNQITLDLQKQCTSRGITYIAPLHLDDTPKTNKNSSIVNSMYCYISPRYFWKEMDWRNETFREYSKRTHYAMRLFKNVFAKKQLRYNKLNYDIV